MCMFFSYLILAMFSTLLWLHEHSRRWWLIIRHFCIILMVPIDMMIFKIWIRSLCHREYYCWNIVLSAQWGANLNLWCLRKLHQIPFRIQMHLCHFNGSLSTEVIVHQDAWLSDEQYAGVRTHCIFVMFNQCPGYSFLEWQHRKHKGLLLLGRIRKEKKIRWRILGPWIHWW